MNLPRLKNQKIILVTIVFLSSFLCFYANSVNASTQATNDSNENDSIQAVVDKDPEFPGGNAARIEFIQQNIRYPEDAQRNKLEGKVNIQFVVNSVGQIIQSKVVKKLSPSLDEEALRIINLFPRWIPGELNGKKVPTYRIMQVAFKYTPNDDAVENWQITDSTLIVIDSIKLPLKFNLEVINNEQIDTGFILKPYPAAALNKLIEQYGQTARNGVLLLKTYDHPDYKNDTLNTKIRNKVNGISEVNKGPQFPGGDEALMNYIGKKLKYPIIELENGHQGKVTVRFVIDSNGKINDPIVAKSVSPLLDKEALRIISEMPDWIPAEINGIKTKVEYSLPINFRIEGVTTNHSSNLRFDSLQIILDGQVLPISFRSKWLDFAKLASMNTIVPKKKTEKNTLIEKYGPNAANGIILATSQRENKDSKGSVNLEKDSLGNKIYDVVEKMPEYMGGNIGLLDFLQKNLIYPESEKSKNIQGTVILFFTVNSLGKIENARVIRGLSSECDKEALRLINLPTIWTPGQHNGVPVSVRLTVPITFKNTTVNKSITNSLNTTNRKANFPGGLQALSTYIAKNLKYPVRAMENDQRGQVLVEFTVNELGVVDNVRTIYKKNENATLLEEIVVNAIGISNSGSNNESPQGNSNRSNANFLEKEAISVVKSIPKWTPGQKDGQGTSELFVLPILFKKHFQN